MKPRVILPLALLLAAALPLRADDDLVQQPDGMAPSASIHANINIGGANIDAQASTGGDYAPAEPAPEVVPQMPSEEQQDYALGVSDYYGVPPERVWDYMDRGIRPEELPVVYHLAATAGVSPRYVVSLRVQGLTWQEVAISLGLGPDAFYWDDVFSVDFGGPFSGIYLGFHRYPRSRWAWGRIAFSDVDIINCVGLRFTSVYWHRPLVEVVRERREGRPYFTIGHRYNVRYGAPYYVRHDRHWGGNYHEHFKAHVTEVRAGRWHRNQWQGGPPQARPHGNGGQDTGRRHKQGNDRWDNKGGHGQGNAYGHGRKQDDGGQGQGRGNAYGHGRKQDDGGQGQGNAYGHGRKPGDGGQGNGGQGGDSQGQGQSQGNDGGGLDNGKGNGGHNNGQGNGYGVSHNSGHNTGAAGNKHGNAVRPSRQPRPSASRPAPSHNGGGHAEPRAEKTHTH